MRRAGAELVQTGYIWRENAGHGMGVLLEPPSVLLTCNLTPAPAPLRIFPRDGVT